MKNVPVRSFIRTVLSLLLGVALIAWVTPGPLAGQPAGKAKPKSIILFIADGMGIGQHTLAYYFADSYPLDRFEHVGLMTTHPYLKDRVTDSGAAATAMATGHKTHQAVIGIDADGNRVENALEVAESRGKVTGIVTTAAITDATPAAFAAHQQKRSDHEEIALQMTSAGVEVLLGGGRKYFTKDRDGNDLLQSLENSGVQIIFDLTSQLDEDRPLLGLFAPGEMETLPVRTPSLRDMVSVAMGRLKDHPEGFFLVIEDEGVDTESHRNKTDGVIAAMNDLMATMSVLLDYQAENQDVLLIFTGDHETGGLILERHRSNPGRLKWTTGSHTGNMIPIFASGPGSAAFDGLLDNTDVGKLLIKYLQ